MDPKLKDTVLDQIAKAENIAIVISNSLGFDGLAAGLSLYLSLIKLDKNVSVVANAPTVGDAQSLYGVDRIGNEGVNKNPVIVVENAIETVDKVTHFLDKDKLRLIIHPLPGTPPISENQIKIEYSSTPASLIFAIGIDNLPDLRSQLTNGQEITPEALIVNLSNSQPSQKFAQIDIVNTQAASVSEVTAKMIQDFALPLDEDIAFNLYSGVRATTNNFSPSIVSQITLEIASWLLKFGAGKASLARQTVKSPQMYPQQPNMPRPIAKQPFPFPFPQMNPTPRQTQQPPTVDEDLDDDFFEKMTRLEDVEAAAQGQEAPKSSEWLKPPKIYKGSKSPGGEGGKG